MAQRREYRKNVVRSPENISGDIWRSAAARSRACGGEFTITRQWIAKQIHKGVCAVTGIPFSLERTHGRQRNPWAPSLDRIRNDVGYTFWNVQVVCWKYNLAKADGTHGELVRLARAILCPETNHPEVTANG